MALWIHQTLREITPINKMKKMDIELMDRLVVMQTKAEDLLQQMSRILGSNAEYLKIVIELL